MRRRVLNYEQVTLGELPRSMFLFRPTSIPILNTPGAEEAWS